MIERSASSGAVAAQWTMYCEIRVRAVSGVEGDRSEVTSGKKEVTGSCLVCI